MRKIACYLVFSIVLVLQGCAQAPLKTLPQQDQLKSRISHQANIANIQRYTLDGRMGLQASGQGFSGKIKWQHLPESDDIALFSPLGGQVAQITKNETVVTLTDNKGKSVSAANIKTLMQENLGWHIPVASLENWALGRPAQSQGAQSNAQWDKQGRLERFSQDGWEVIYKSYTQTNGYDLPSKLTLRKNGLFLKLIISSWVLN